MHLVTIIVNTVAEAESLAKERRIPVDDLIKAAGVDRSTWSRWRTGATTPRWKHWRGVIQKLNEPVAPAPEPAQDAAA